MSTYAKLLLQQLNFSEARIASLLPKLVIRSFEVGETIWSKGKSVDSWFCIMSGYVGAAVPLEEGGQLPIHIHGPESWFGEQSLIGHSPTHLEYVCLTPVEVIGFEAKYLDEALCNEPGFSLFMANLLSSRVQQHSEMLMLMRMGSPCLRVVMGLAQFAETMTYCTRTRSRGESEQAVEIPIKQAVLAALCGVSRTLFSDFIQQLSAAGLLCIQYGAIEIVSLDRWREFARKHRESRNSSQKSSMNQLLADFGLHSKLCKALPPARSAEKRWSGVLPVAAFAS